MGLWMLRLLLDVLWEIVTPSVLRESIICHLTFEISGKRPRLRGQARALMRWHPMIDRWVNCAGIGPFFVGT